MNTHVNFEVSKLLKEKGFKKSTDANWWILTKDHSDNYLNGRPVDESKIFFTKDSYELELKIQIDEDREHNVFHVLSAPTVAEVVMWLYENHGIWIYTWNSDINMTFRVWIQNLRIKSNDTIEVPNIKICNSPTEAYEAAILYTLNNLI